VRQVWRDLRRDHRATGLAVLALVQALCAVFFLADVIHDLRVPGNPDGVFLSAEIIATLALAAGVAVQLAQLARLVRRMEALESGIRLARGEVQRLIEAQFQRWDLTPSERDVALLILRGLDNEAIAAARGTRPGTVRAQSARVYAKAGVDSRAQLFSIFIDELMVAD